MSHESNRHQRKPAQRRQYRNTAAKGAGAFDRGWLGYRIWDTEFIQLGGKDIRGCRACYQCFKKKNSRCGQKDDGFNACLEKMLQADAIILGSPTYFTDVSAEMKALLDRAGLVAVANGGLFRRTNSNRIDVTKMPDGLFPACH